MRTIRALFNFDEPAQSTEYNQTLFGDREAFLLPFLFFFAVAEMPFSVVPVLDVALTPTLNRAARVSPAWLCLDPAVLGLFCGVLSAAGSVQGLLARSPPPLRRPLKVSDARNRARLSENPSASSNRERRKRAPRLTAGDREAQRREKRKTRR